MNGLLLDDSLAAPTGVVSTRFSVENRGRTPSEASEIRLCIASGEQCIGEVVELPLGVLQSGERVEFTQPVPSYAGTDAAPPYTLLARIDPDRATSESNRANNDASKRIVVDTALLTVTTFDVPPLLRYEASQVPMTLVVQNASSVSTSAAMALALSGRCSTSGLGTTWGDEATRLRVPPLAPGQSWTVTANVQHPGALPKPNIAEAYPCTLSAQLVPTRPSRDDRTFPAVLRPYRIDFKR